MNKNELEILSKDNKSNKKLGYKCKEKKFNLKKVIVTYYNENDFFEKLPLIENDDTLYVK